MSIKKDIEKYLEFGMMEYFENISTQKVKDYLGYTKQEQVDKLKNSVEFKQLKELLKRFDNKIRLGFSNVKKFEKWVEQAKKHKKWGFIKADDKLIEKYENGDFGFKTFKRFYEWYVKEPQKCYYCGTTQEQLNKIFKEKDEENERNTKPLYSKKRSFTATLQIEKLNPNKPYNEANCKLACVFCNNVKSDMVNETNFETYFVEIIKNFLDDMFQKGKTANEMPFFEDTDAKLYHKSK